MGRRSIWLWTERADELKEEKRWEVRTGTGKRKGNANRRDSPSRPPDPNPQRLTLFEGSAVTTAERKAT